MWKVGAAHTPAEKTRLLCPLLPPEPEPSLPKLIDSNLWLATTTNQCGTHNVECQETMRPQIQWMKMDTLLKKSPTWPSQPWSADIHQDAKKTASIPYKFRSMQDDNPNRSASRATQSPTIPKRKPPSPLSNVDPPRWKSSAKPATHHYEPNSDNPLSPEKPSSSRDCLNHKTLQLWTLPDLRPTRIVVQRHSFWRATPTSCPVQEWIFNIADSEHHKVCIVLLWGKSRLYGSFPDAESFWTYYSNFKARRCFYWINRSYEVGEEASILPFDIE